MRALFVIGATALLAGRQPAPTISEPAKAPVTATCAEGAVPLPGTGLCPAEAELAFAGGAHRAEIS